jgi:hypothetical protein
MQLHGERTARAEPTRRAGHTPPTCGGPTCCCVGRSTLTRHQQNKTNKSAGGGATHRPRGSHLDPDLPPCAGFHLKHARYAAASRLLMRPPSPSTNGGPTLLLDKDEAGAREGVVPSPRLVAMRGEAEHTAVATQTGHARSRSGHTDPRDRRGHGPWVSHHWSQDVHQQTALAAKPGFRYQMLVYSPRKWALSALAAER